MWLVIGCANNGGWLALQTKSPQEFPPAPSQTASDSKKAPASPAPGPNMKVSDVRGRPEVREEAPREVEVTRQVNDQVERLKKAYDQSQQAKKSDVTITSVTPVDDSDSLAAKLTQKPASAPKKAVETPAPKAAAATAERPTIMPIKRPAPVTPAEQPVRKAKPVSPQASAETKNVKILNVESVEGKTSQTVKVLPPAPAPVEKTQPTVTVPVDPSPKPANQSIKLDIPEPNDPAVAMDQLLTKLEKKLQERPNDTSTQVKLRLVYAVLGQWQQALKDSGGKDTTDGELARDLISLIKVFDNPELAPAQQANEALNLLDRLQELLRRQADLKVSNMQFCREVVSFGCYKAMPVEYFVAGKTLPVIVYLELDNFTSKKLGEDNYQTLLSLTMEIVTESGKVCWRQHDDKIEDTANKQRRDFYIARLINLPAALPSGKLGLKVTVEDLNGNKVAQRNLPFELKTSR
jgi:hypothetical protein